MMEENDAGASRDPWVEGILGFAWMFTSALLVCGSGAVMLIALGTHVLIRLRPGTSRIVTYDPSTIGSIAFIPVVAGLAMAALFLLRLRRYRLDAR